MKAALSLVIIEFSSPVWSLQIGFGSYKGWQPITAILKASSKKWLCSQLGRWPADWPVSGMPSHVPAYS